jgi:hypothetical protein
MCHVSLAVIIWRTTKTFAETGGEILTGIETAHECNFSDRFAGLLS